MRAFLGLGSNLGDREGNLRAGLRWLSPECRVVAVSSLYESAAVVVEGAEAGPDFYNAVCEVETELSAEDLLRHVKRIEHDMGRRPGERWTARPIDIDILLYGDEIIEVAMAEGVLVIPHPLMYARDFVMVPLAEIASGVVHPGLGRTVGELAADIEYEGLTHVSDPSWWS
jgi:2-amino-4-hydroxy-6-hydroxymethyldihydropteridine diphosphokinase